MEVTLLGTGNSYTKYNCASCIIDKKILVDIGPGTIKELIKLNYSLENIESILITHLHSDHILDFENFIVNLEVLKTNKKIKILGPKGTEELLVKLLQLFYKDYYDEFVKEHIEFIEINDDVDFLNFGNYKIKIEKVNHYGMESYGYIIDGKIGITGDTTICKGVKNIFDNSKIMIADCSLIKGDINHMGIDNIVDLIEENPNKQIIVTHLREETRKILNDMNVNNIIIKEDGYIFNI